jgi:dipeptidyl aminopeptidase/acylaminoacyl peptidase
MRTPFLGTLVPILLILAPGAAAQDRMSPELLWKLGRVGGGTLSTDGTKLAYTVKRYDLAENEGESDLHLLELTSGRDRIVVDGWKSIGEVQWARVGGKDRLFFIGLEGKKEDGGKDDKKESPQVHSLDPTGGEVRAVTSIEDGVGNLKVSPTGKAIAFTRDIKMDPTVNDLYPDLPKADARIIDSLLFRHWNAWHDFKYSHVHAADLGEDGTAGEARDLMEGIRADCPLPPFGGSSQYAWSPDGAEIAYTAKIANNWAESTDSDIYLIPAKGEGGARCITHGMNGYDTDPVYSPDGSTLLFHSMERAGFEADRNRIMLYDRSGGSIREATAGLDQTAHGALWSRDGKSVYFVSEHLGTNQVFRVETGKAGATQVTRGRFNFSLLETGPDGRNLLVAQQSILRPAELASVSIESGQIEVLTGVNDALYRKLALPRIEERHVRASDGAQIQCWVIYPPDFDPAKKWPMLTYCQGGPQGQIGQWFSYRWNFHLMAAQGYVVLAVNRRGLPGFGQEWNDSISGDWGGQAMQDILAATDEMQAQPWIDVKRCAAIGASFGGYTVYWLMGNHEDRFSCMVAHCGVFNLESMYGSTEELFFVNWDLGGPYWSSAETQASYDRFSPHRFVGKWRTPLLVVHGEKDFRVPVTQGMEAFTAAQVQGVPSRFLYYPAEGHWVLGPQNGVLWHRVFFDWLKKWTGDPRTEKKSY